MVEVYEGVEKIRTVIVEYGMGNIKSVYNALKKLGTEALVVNNPSKLSADKIIIPGVGSFGDGVGNLKRFIPKIEETLNSTIPLLGICLGLQMFFEESEESSNVRGLGLIKGRVVKIKTGLKLPHIGWNYLKIEKKSSRLLEGIQNGYVYFVHSYHAVPDEDVIVATTDYDSKITAAVEKNNLFGVQFHPEKSGVLGLEMLKNFLEL